MNQTVAITSSEAHSSKRMTWALVLPYLLAIWSCLSIIQRATTDIPPAEILIPTIVKVLLVIGFIHFVLLFLIRATPARELTLLTIVSFFALFGAAKTAFTVGEGMISESLFLAIWTILHVVAVVAMLRMTATKFTESLILAMGVSAAVMVGFQVTNITLPVAHDLPQLDALVKQLDETAESKQLNVVAASEDQTNADPTDLPDIYYIIVDAYARGDILDQVYEFDNQPFIESLHERGFYVADESRSNYNMTEFSLASSLNMRHLSGLGLEKFKTRLPMRELIRENAVAKTLKQSGYTTIAFATGKCETECNNFDQYIPYNQALCDYQDVLYHGTPLPWLVEMTGATRSAARRHGDRTLFAFDMLPKVAENQTRPAFVFCHMLSPHPPFLFDPAGKEVDLHGHYLLADWLGFTSCFGYDLSVYRDGYRDQVAFMNQKLIQMVDKIQQSKRRSIIIIQGDHGPRMGFGHRRSEWQNCEWRFRESFSILNAICMPSSNSSETSSKFYPAMTPVNTFRLIFNDLFKTDLALESDTSFLELDYTFSDLTETALPLKAGEESEVKGALAKARINSAKALTKLNKTPNHE